MLGFLMDYISAFSFLGFLWFCGRFVWFFDGFVVACWFFCALLALLVLVIVPGSCWCFDFSFMFSDLSGAVLIGFSCLLPATLRYLLNTFYCEK